MIEFTYSEKLEAYVASIPGNLQGSYYTNKEFTELENQLYSYHNMAEKFVNLFNSNSKCYQYVMEHLNNKKIRGTSDNIAKFVVDYLLYVYPNELAEEYKKTKETSSLAKELVKRVKKMESNF